MIELEESGSVSASRGPSVFVKFPVPSPGDTPRARVRLGRSSHPGRLCRSGPSHGALRRFECLPATTSARTVFAVDASCCRRGRHTARPRARTNTLASGRRARGVFLDLVGGLLLPGSATTARASVPNNCSTRSARAVFLVEGMTSREMAAREEGARAAAARRAVAGRRAPVFCEEKGKR